MHRRLYVGELPMQLGILVDNLGNNQISFNIINEVNSLIFSKSEVSPTVFYKNPSNEVLKLASAATSLDKAYFYKGIVISTNLDLALFSLNMPSPTKKYLYLYEIEWSLTPKFDFNLTNIILNKLDGIICPSIAYQNELLNYSGISAKLVVPNFKLKEIINELSKT